MKTADDVLAHFGVKGMKWGVRRNRPSVTPSSDAANVTAVKEKVKTGGTKSLSNKELQDLITRMNLEQQYSRLNPGKIQKGLQVTSDILRIGGTINQVVSFVNSPAGKAVREALIKK